MGIVYRASLRGKGFVARQSPTGIEAGFGVGVGTRGKESQATLFFSSRILSKIEDSLAPWRLGIWLGVSRCDGMKATNRPKGDGSGSLAAAGVRRGAGADPGEVPPQ